MPVEVELVELVGLSEVEDDVAEVGVDEDVAVSSEDVLTDAELGVGPSFDESASAVPAERASAPAATAPTSSFLVMSVPSSWFVVPPRCPERPYGRAARRLTRA